PITCDDTIDAPRLRLLGHELEPQLLPDDAGKKAAHRMLLPAGRIHHVGEGCALRLTQELEDRILLGGHRHRLVFVKCLGRELLCVALRTSVLLRLLGGLRIGHYRPPLRWRRQSAPSPPKPRGGRGALAGRWRTFQIYVTW